MYLAPIPSLFGGVGSGPGRFVSEGKPRGPLGWFMSPVGPVWGTLSLTDGGIGWKPKWLARRWGFRSFEIPWSSFRGADCQLMWMSGPSETVLVVELLSGERLEFALPRYDKRALEATLETFLERPTAPDPPLGLA